MISSGDIWSIMLLLHKLMNDCIPFKIKPTTETIRSRIAYLIFTFVNTARLVVIADPLTSIILATDLEQDLENLSNIGSGL